MCIFRTSPNLDRSREFHRSFFRIACLDNKMRNPSSPSVVRALEQERRDAEFETQRCCLQGLGILKWPPNFDFLEEFDRSFLRAPARVTAVGILSVSKSLAALEQERQRDWVETQGCQHPTCPLQENFRRSCSWPPMATQLGTEPNDDLFRAPSKSQVNWLRIDGVTLLTIPCIKTELGLIN